MRWRWPWLREPDGEHARAAKAAAADQLADAHGQAPKVAEVTRAAWVLTRQTDRLTRDIERSMRLRGAP